jgi:hypothetical protein
MSQHPCLVAFEGYTTAPHLCIIQELVPRGSLYDAMKTTGLKPLALPDDCRTVCHSTCHAALRH